VREGLERESQTLRTFNVQTSFYRGHICVFYCSVVSLSSLSYIYLPGGRSKSPLQWMTFQWASS